MAWRQRPSGATTVRPRQTNRPIYEDYQPETNINEQEGARIVILHVPGFLKDQLKILLEHGSNIRVQGQRPLVTNRWSRFNQLLPIPQNCDVNKIHAKFHNGTLTITMPKEVPPQRTSIMSPKEEKPAEKTTQESINNVTPPKTTDTKELPSSSDPNWKAEAAAAEPRAQTGQEKSLPTANKDVDAEKISERTFDTEKKAEKGGERVPQTVTSTKEKDEKQRVEKKIGGALSPPKQREESQRSANEKLGESVNARKVKDSSLGKEKESTQKAREPSGALAGVNVSKILDEGKEALQKLIPGTANEEKSKEEGSSTSENKLGVNYIAETAKQTLTNAVKRLNDEDRQILMNIGAAVLVIVALGAYVSYNFGSSSKSEN